MNTELSAAQPPNHKHNINNQYENTDFPDLKIFYSIIFYSI